MDARSYADRICANYLINLLFCQPLFPDSLLVADAIEQAIAHAGIDPADIGMLVVGNMMSGILAQQQQLGALCADVAGLRGIEAATVEAACGSGAAAARWGYMAVAGGFYDIVLVGGLERM